MPGLPFLRRSFGLPHAVLLFTAPSSSRSIARQAALRAASVCSSLSVVRSDRVLCDRVVASTAVVPGRTWRIKMINDNPISQRARKTQTPRSSP